MFHLFHFPTQSKWITVKYSNVIVNGKISIVVWRYSKDSIMGRIRQRISIVNLRKTFRSIVVFYQRIDSITVCVLLGLYGPRNEPYIYRLLIVPFDHGCSSAKYFSCFHYHRRKWNQAFMGSLI